MSIAIRYEPEFVRQDEPETIEAATITFDDGFVTFWSDGGDLIYSVDAGAIISMRELPYDPVAVKTLAEFGVKITKSPPEE